MNSTCECGCAHVYHRAPNDIAVILNRKAVDECALCGRCKQYRHAKGPLPKPRQQPSPETIKAVREAAYRRTHPAPRPVPAGTRNSYSNDREVPM